MMRKQWSVYFGVMCLLVAAVHADVWQDLAAYTLGHENKAPEQLATLVAQTPVDQQGEIEQKLIAVLVAKDATFDGKSWACRMLQRVGTDASVPALAGLLVDEKLSGYARLPLQRMTGSKAAGKALRDALGKAPDSVKPGIIGSVGERGDDKAVSQLSALLCGADNTIVAEALLALGKIGGEQATKALDEAKVDKNLESGRLDALLMCADESGNAQVYAKVFAGASDTHRVAALRGLIHTDESKACPIVVDLLKADDSYLRRGAMRLIVMEPGAKLTAAVAGALKRFPAEKQAEVIGVLGERGDKTALAALASCLESQDEAVRAAAIAATAELGGAEQVKALLGAGESALAAVARMTDPQVDVKLIKLLREKSVAPFAVKALASRGCVTAVPPMLTLTAADSPELRKAAWEALASLATDENAAALMKALLIANDSDTRLAENALKKLCGTARDKTACFDVVAASYGEAEASTKALILDLGAITGGPKALALAKGALAGDAGLRDRALRALAAWSNADAAPALLELVEGSTDAKEQILALRGYIRAAGVDEKRPSWKDKMKIYQTAAGLATRVDEKRLVISGLRKVRRPEALKELEAYLSDEALKHEAAMAAVDLGWDLRKHHRETVAAVSTTIMDSATDKGILSKAKRNFNETKPKSAPKK